MFYKNFKPILSLSAISFMIFSFIGTAAARDSGVRDITLELESPSTIAFLIIAGLIALIVAYFILSKS